MTQDLQWDAARGSNASPTPRTSKSTTTFTRLAQTSQGNITVQNTTGLGIHETARYKGVIERPQPSLAPVPGVDVSAPAPAVLTLGETYSPAIGNERRLPASHAVSNVYCDYDVITWNATMCDSSSVTSSFESFESGQECRQDLTCDALVFVHPVSPSRESVSTTPECTKHTYIALKSHHTPGDSPFQNTPYNAFPTIRSLRYANTTSRQQHVKVYVPNTPRRHAELAEYRASQSGLAAEDYIYCGPSGPTATWSSPKIREIHSEIGMFQEEEQGENEFPGLGRMHVQQTDTLAMVAEWLSSSIDNTLGKKSGPLPMHCRREFTF